MLLRQNIVVWVGLLLGLSALSLGCDEEGDPATALVLSVQSDLKDIAEVEAAVFPDDVDPSKKRPDDERVTTVEAKPDELPVAIVISKGEADEVMISVRALDAKGKPLAEVRTRAQFAAGKTLRLPITLSDVCRGKLCDAKAFETCYAEEHKGVEAGECGPIPLVLARELEEITEAKHTHAWDPVFVAPRAGDMDGGGDADTGPTVSNDPIMMQPALTDSAIDSAIRDGGDGGDGGDASPPDAGTCVKPPLAMAQCGLAPMCNCPANQTCHLTGAQETSCRPVGTTPPNSACAGDGDCTAGHGCVGSRCTPYCQTDSDCGSGGVCINVNIDGTAVPGVNACLISCNPASSTACGKGVVCANYANRTIGGRTINGNFCVNEPSCTSSAIPSTCGTGNQCVGGLCRKGCTSNDQCGAGTTCDAEFGYCASSCNTAVANSCGDDLVCGSGSLCVRPESPCPYRGDNVCDEPEGSKWCVDGTDPVDCAPLACATTPPYQGPCDLISQCGCARNQECLDTGVSASGVLTVTCSPLPTATPVRVGEVCSSTQLCAKGHTCITDTGTVARCRRNCRSNTDCAGTNTTCDTSIFVTVNDAGVQLQNYGACVP